MCSVEGQILILDIHKYSTYVVEVFGLIFNFLVIYLLNTDNKSTKTSYKVCIIMHCIMDIGLGFFHLIGIFQVEAVGGTIFMTLPGVMQYINVYLAHTWCFTITNFLFTCSIFCGSITIIYRYLVVVKRKTLETKSILFMAVPIILTAAVSASQYVTSYGELPEEEYQTYKKLLNKNVWARDKVYGEDFIALTTPVTRKTEPFYNYFTIASFVIVAAIIIIFSILISIHLKGNRSNMTESTLKLEKQIQTTLFIQALLPIILGYIPNILPSFMLMFNVPFQCYIIFVGVCITYIPLINPCILLFLTPQYKKRIFNCFMKEGRFVGAKTTIFIK
uniref:G_PROTEIN_RECEP_F1_2 domain-containing protein n=1 Tax=Strongyloides papillosus TaxID=174720 RepID=A0A0N5BKJ4_STREA